MNIDLKKAVSNPLGKKLIGLFEPWLVRFMKLNELLEIYNEIEEKTEERKKFVSVALQVFSIKYEIGGEGLEMIPKKGPVIVIANHPYGGIEGIILTDLLRSVREDSLIMANYLLNQLSGMAQYLIAVDPFGSDASKQKNCNPMRQAFDKLSEGEILGIFPSGAVSFFHLKKMEITDPKWNRSIVKLARRTDASIVPVYFHGRNSLFFQIAGFFHPMIRTALLGRELINKKGKTIHLEIGKPIMQQKIAEFTSDNELLEYLRLRTYILKNRSTVPKKSPWLKKVGEKNYNEPLASPVDKILLKKDIKGLKESDLVLHSGNFDVYAATADRIPNVLEEIGRSREETFRNVSEGTGKRTDIDRFDHYYIHLFCWDKKEDRLVGAYRLGKTDKIIEHYGIQGLYTSTLFKISHRLISQLGPSVEVGRSFIVGDYQKNYLPLMLLWKGIVHYVLREPKYKNLFGLVSINSEYDRVSQQLIISFLKANNYQPDMAKLVKPRKSPRKKKLNGFDMRSMSRVIKDVKNVSQLITEIEATAKGMPILLRQYLKLGGKILGFNIDPNFGNVLDGLILVDLTELDSQSAEKYMSKEGAKKFLHGTG